MPVIYRLQISESSVCRVKAAPWWIVCLSPPDINLYVFHFTAEDCYNDVGCRLYTLPKTCEQSSVRLYNFLQGTTVTYHSLEVEEKVVFPISPATFSDLLLIALTISNETPINFHFGANFQTALCVSHAWSNNEISQDPTAGSEPFIPQNVSCLLCFPDHKLYRRALVVTVSSYIGFIFDLN